MKMFFFLLLISVSISVYGQKGKAGIDSLLRELSAAQEDTSKVNLLGLLSFSYSEIDPDEGLKYGLKAKELSEKLGWKKGIASSCAELGINYAAKSEHAKAIHYNQKALELYKELDDENSVAAIFANNSLVYKAQGDYPKALDYAFKALQTKNGHIDRKTEAIILENIGTIYLEQKDYSKTIEYYDKALKVYEELGDKRGIARNLGNSGIVEDAKGNYNRSLTYHFKALEANQEQGNINGVQINLANIGYVYSHLHDYSKALEHQFKALKISEDLGIKSSIAINLGNIGETYFTIASSTTGTIKQNDLIPEGKLSNLKLSVHYLEKALSICKEIDFAAPQVEFGKYLSDALFLSGDYKRSFEVYKDHTKLKDSIFSQKSKVELSNLETQRALELKDKDIIIKNKELEIRKLGIANSRKERVIYISGIVLMLVIVGFAFRWFVKRNRVQKNVLSEIAHIQSHEVRGPVARILGLAQLFNHQDTKDPLNKELIVYISAEAKKLDEITRKVVLKSTGKIHDEVKIDI